MNKDYEIVRGRVVSVGSDTMVCDTPDCGRVAVALRPGQRYLADLLRTGMRVNLVDVHEGCARFVVAEPDYLVNATAVAACMADYGDSPLVGIVRRLAPAPNSQAIQMGNFAGRLLDEALHGESSAKPYSQSVRDFFGTSALGIMARGSDFDSRSFHMEAQRQKHNIAVAVERGLPVVAPGFSPCGAMVEPSFFCEALGLQGRMDCLTEDAGVVVEQKSGKGAWGARHPDIPEIRREHYAQLLLYKAALRYGYPGTDARAVLMYSHYASPLVDVAESEPLLEHAIELRNRIALAEMECATRGYDFLASITPDTLNTAGTFGRLWTGYQRPQLQAVLQPIACADDLERAYFMRMMRFVACEHRLGKEAFASAWLRSTEDKRASGDILDGLRLCRDSVPPSGKVERVALSVADGDNGVAANFRVADIVLLYPYGQSEEPDLRRALPLRCTIRAIDESEVELELRTPQSDGRLLMRRASDPWAIEHDFIEAGSDAQYRGLHSLLAAPRERRALVLGRRKPVVAAGYELSRDYGSFNELVVRAMQARDLFLLLGPPGTGKTSHGLMNILAEELSHESASVLLTAYTNRAVDEICSKLEESGTDYVRLGSASACAPLCRRRTVDAIVGAAASLGGVRQRLATVRVVVGTTAAVNARIELLAMRRFSLAIIDEASQILEPQLAGMLGAVHDGESAISRIVMIGDHKQLPAVVRQPQQESRVDNPVLLAAGINDCRVSLFERLIRLHHGDDGVVYRLRHQGRMHPAVAEFAATRFYGGDLHPVPLGHQLNAAEAGRLRFVAVSPDAADLNDKVNKAEAHAIAGLVAGIYCANPDAFDAGTTVGVIVPYRNQITAVRRALRLRCPEAAGITIDTVERYQGSQRDHIIFGCTVRSAAQLEFLAESTIVDADGTVVDRRLNVALTRAREQFIMVGNPKILVENDIYADLIDFLQKKDARV
ncbi:MAG: DNA2/NAM7 family helicase [Muribaculaceae bacterium]|nr:DNA2/NAM7 family helicase [Muribaculaceae bacterium]